MERELRIGISTIVLPVDSVNSVLNLLRPSEAIGNLTIIGSDNGLSPGAKPLSEPMLVYCQFDP